MCHLFLSGVVGPRTLLVTWHGKLSKTTTEAEWNLFDFVSMWVVSVGNDCFTLGTSSG